MEEKKRGFARKEFILHQNRIEEMRAAGYSITEIYQILKEEGKITMSPSSLYSKLSGKKYRRKKKTTASHQSSTQEKEQSSHQEKTTSSFGSTKPDGKILDGHVDPNDLNIEHLLD